jgi:hypothetical protein
VYICTACCGAAIVQYALLPLVLTHSRRMQMYSFPRHHHISGVSRCLMASLGRPRSGSFARFLLLGIRKSSKCSTHDALDSHAHNSLRKGTRHFESAALRAARREMGVAALLKHGPHLRLPPPFRRRRLDNSQSQHENCVSSKVCAANFWERARTCDFLW